MGKEIAKELRIKETTAKTKLYRMLKNIREMYGDEIKNNGGEQQ